MVKISDLTYDESEVRSCIDEMRTLAESNDYQNTEISTGCEGDVINKIRDVIVPKLDALNDAVNSLISAAAEVSDNTLQSLIALDNEYEEIQNIS